MAQDLLELQIIRPTEVQRFEVAYLEVQTETGNFIVGPDHVPLIAILKQKGDLIYWLADGSRKKIDVFGGIFTIENGKARTILDK